MINVMATGERLREMVLPASLRPPIARRFLELAHLDPQGEAPMDGCLALYFRRERRAAWFALLLDAIDGGERIVLSPFEA